MAKTKAKKQSGADIDWYLISIDRLKQIGLVVLLILLGVAGWWFWQSQKGNPKTTAESAITDARQALNSLAASKDYNARRAEFNRAQQKLEEANTHLAAAKYVEAHDSAVESQTISRAALSGDAAEASDAQFLTVEGTVEYQRGSPPWKNAEPRVALSNGDWVRTGDRASAELMFANGSVYTIGPNAMLEIYAAVNPTTSEKQNAVQMRVGSVEVATSSEATSIRTPGTQVVVETDSTTQIGVDDSKATSVVATRGAASVAPEQGGAAVRVAAGEKVSSTPEGAISPVKKLSAPPGLQAPADNQIFQLSPTLKVEFVWAEQEGAGSYLLQVSRSRLFATREINSKRAKNSAVASVTSEGAFYWRVASIGTDGEVGPFSPFRRFRVSGGGKTVSADKIPPKLTLNTPFHVGGPFYTISGTTEPGATVFINDEEVDVKSTGVFEKLVSFEKIGRNAVVVKAVDAAGNPTVQSQTVIVEE